MRGWSTLWLVLGGIAVLFGAVMLAGASPAAVTLAFLKGSFGDASHLSQTLVKTTPLLIAGIAVFIGLRAGLFNIGVEGQLVIGALACAAVAVKLPGAGGAVLGTIAGVVAGALWALPAAVIKAYRGGHEVITTIMLNSVAGFLTLYLAAGPLKAPGQDHPTTADVLTRLPDLSVAGLKVNAALVVAVLLVFAVAYWLRRTVAGYELEAVGANPLAAEFAGIDRRKVVVSAMCASGAIAGAAGVVQVLALEGRFFPEISSGIGFDALGVALLAGGSPIGLLVSSLGFGALTTGGTQLAIEGVPKGITQVVLGILIVAAAALRYRKVVTVA